MALDAAEHALYEARLTQWEQSLPMTTADRNVARNLLKRRLKVHARSGKNSVVMHSVGWDHAHWHASWKRKYPSLAPLIPKALKVLDRSGSEEPIDVSRGSLFAAANSGDDVSFFILTMAWGYGTGYGWERTARALTEDGVASVKRSVGNLRAAFDGALAGQEGVAAFRAWNSKAHATGGAKIYGVGPAFASKLAYFLSYNNQTGFGPLIADENTAWGIWLTADVWDCRRSSKKYQDYLDEVGRLATKLGVRTDAVELALFELGKDIPKRG